MGSQKDRKTYAGICVCVCVHVHVHVCVCVCVWLMFAHTYTIHTTIWSVCVCAANGDFHHALLVFYNPILQPFAGTKDSRVAEIQ